jgi:hypothetical protein
MVQALNLKGKPGLIVGEGLYKTCVLLLLYFEGTLFLSMFQKLRDSLGFEGLLSQ